MYKVMLVDDEKYIRKSMVNRISWEKLGAVIAAEAQNGMEAMEMLEMTRPHIVFVDIRMPLMDGLTFIEQAKKKFPDICYVITSAYSEFDYAKQAIKLGVEDYVLKPVNVSEVEQLVTKLIKGIREKEIAQSLRKSKAEEGSEMKMRYSRVRAVAFYLKESEGADRVIRESLEEAVRLYCESDIYKWEHYSGNCIVFLINSQKTGREEIRSAVENAWEHLEQKEGTAAWSEELDAADSRQAVENTVDLLKRKLFFPERKLISVQENEKQGVLQQKEKIRETLNHIYQYQLKNTTAVLESELKQLPAMIVNRNNTVRVIEEAIAELVVLLRRLAGTEADETETGILFHKIQEKDYLLFYDTDTELKTELLNIIDSILQQFRKPEGMDTIDQIKQYIRLNYSENLNATDIAKRFFLNTSYLSAMFKEKTGMNMTTYIEAVRMEKAKVLLKNSKMSITEISMHTGYTESNYFSKVFKKYTGMSPKQYRGNE